ncbi:uroporphyrinogen decarboxylase [Alkalibacter rhizosphaerae]|uniref:Uroporphyrinogen decarboxylase n=1 Tax=Alkalibacter rhizosphaerae TaxID=2815577 RepID=A0A974XFW6_9FIRM|nr:uroporphyrinogen decarboxylase family protein [Alkalibacter rhizosphaerae]QSX09011.1 uroporphyrinogen decarboxylase [Alkalibacter rhizosphaerae]
MTQRPDNPQQMKEYRTKLFEDLFTGVIPDRIPVKDAVGLEFLIQYSGRDLMTTQYQYSTELLVDIFEKGREICRGDTPVSAFARDPIGLMFQKSSLMEMSKSGFIQHAEKSVMDAEDYDEFIKNPYDFVLEVLQPRINKGYDNDVNRAHNYAKSLLSGMEQGRAFGEAEATMVERYGLFRRPFGSVGMQIVPFDFITDMYRGFSKIPMDMRRCPEKLLEALEAIMPYAIWLGKPNVINPLGCNMIMTHMAAFLSTEQFEKFYFPTFNKVCHIAAEQGQPMQIFLEGDWTRFIDHLQELPQGTQLWMEYGDPQKFKDKLGKKMVLGGFYPLTLLGNGTKQQCIDKAKELIDILAPGGNYQFITDKSALALGDVNPENYVAVLEYILENGKYDNAGELVTTEKKEDSIQKYSHLYPKFESKYVESFEELTKDHPPADPRVEPLMRAAHEKYQNMIDRSRL